MVRFSVIMSVIIGLITAGFLNYYKTFENTTSVVIVSAMVTCVVCALMIKVLYKSATKGSQKIENKRVHVRYE